MGGGDGAGKGAVYMIVKVGEEREGWRKGRREGGRDGDLMGLGKADVDVEVGRGRVGECVTGITVCCG